VITGDYFKALEIAPRGGRVFDARDESTGPPVAIINQTLARREFGDANPIGRQLRTGRSDALSPPRTIVGIVSDVLHSGLTSRSDAEIYVPLTQASAATMYLAARTAADPDRFVGEVRAALATIDPGQPVFQVKSMQSLVNEALLPNTAAMTIMSMFAALALALASVGIYGVTSYAVTQQTREFGVRLALGANPRDVLLLVLRRGLLLVGTGTAIGAAAAVGAGRGLAALLPGVNASDVLPYLAVAGLLLLVGAAACIVPARRAMRLDPVEILRAD
jgi:putative ABC transport system permease protein